ncbi:MAG: WhiB family transcriptional regulator, partial [Candidatus Nanopelagicales bacterium]
MADVSRLPGPNTDFWAWQMQAACRGVDSSVFFHPDGERGNAKATRERGAKLLCANCPVLAKCREHALRVREPFGVWGGLTESEREKVYAGRALPVARTAV